ncbi:hypothetical protein [Desulfuromonas thiophila]|uniref:hypothetical protein n=1 Tax=Desulfuromonas thiophila TaxID=57664 RepID=UPI0029F56197|nr:hypothetical protein [Desulfuromonas thiophila]
MKTALFIFFLLLCSCAYHSEPENNKEFHKVSQLSELEGVYKNKGNPSGYLSREIWSDSQLVIDGKINHETIEFIEVIANNNSITVKAIENGCAVYERTYIEGHDFKVNDGKIIINRDAYLLSRGSGDVIVGPSYEQVTLGLDTNRHGKSTRSEYAAGLVLFLLPVAVSDTKETEYERVSDKPTGFGNCKNR